MSFEAAVEVTDYLRSRGQLSTGCQGAPSITALTGGVSAETLLVEAGRTRLVVKRALDRLLVAGDWTAKPERAITEAAAITLAHHITPNQAPQLLDADGDLNIIVMNAAPAQWVNWRSVLLGGEPDPSAGITHAAAELGTVLGRWQRQTWHDAGVADQFDDYEAFEQLRVSPFHRAVAHAHPSVAARVGGCAQELLLRRDCFVHGDYSPKNVLVGREGLMVLDFEVAHFGAAVFDVAFMLSHLALKALHRPDHAEEFAGASAAFLQAYTSQAPWTDPSQNQNDSDAHPLALQRLGSHIACLLLARVDGLSPAPYLTQSTAKVVRHVALDLLAGDNPSIADVWARTVEPNP